MRKRRSFNLIIALIISAVVASAAYAALQEGDKAPELKLTTLDGKEFCLKSQSKNGKAVVLDVWATTCPPCKAEIPHLEKLHKKYKSKGVVFVGVSVDSNISDVKTFVKNNKVTYKIAYDRGAAKTAKAFKFPERWSIPQLYVINKSGEIIAVHSGFPPDSYPKEQKKMLKEIEDDIKAAIK